MEDRILEALSDSGAPIALRELCARLCAPAEALQPALDALMLDGRVVRTQKGRLALAEAVGLCAARITFQRNGTPLAHLAGGEVLPMDTSGKARCLPDDVVLVRPEGQRYALHSILQRGRTTLPAYVRLERRPSGRGRRNGVHTSATAVPCDPRIPYDVELTGDLSCVENDEIALLRIEEYPEFDRPIRASVVRALGDTGSMRALMRAVAEDGGFSTESPVDVARESAEVPEAVSDEDMPDREDFRDLLAFTIDGATAKDFDDAVSIERTESGWRLGVHIADVSHYVRPGSAIDADALARGTSLYLPGLTVPMLPECLSNSLCSLMPDVDRLAMSLFMDVEDGRIVDHRLVRSVIHSRARLTYQAVNRFFDGGDADIAPEVVCALEEMRTVSRALRARRRSRGAIDLDMDEPEFVLDERGEPVDILSGARGEAERMIEDFMLSANETVAALARSVELPFIYRIHEHPAADRIEALEAFLGSIDLHAHLGACPHPSRLQAVLDGAQAHPARDVVRHHVLRALRRARYSERPLGHYALAMEDYCHFTSPIRRYPDLVVHRMLKRLIDGDIADADRMSERIAALARECTIRENAATQAERRGDAIMMAAYMSRHIGEEYDGVISGVAGWGLYVTLPNQVEGLVHISGLDDYYRFDAERNQLVGEATGTAFRLGDRVRVRVERASAPTGEIDFELLPPRR